MRWLACVALCALVGCQAASDWLGSPAGDGVVVEDGLIEVTLDDGSTVLTMADANGDPVLVTLPDGSQVGWTPTVGPPETKGGVLSRVIGGIAGTVTGNPAVSAGTGGLLALALGALARRKKKSAA